MIFTTFNNPLQVTPPSRHLPIPQKILAKENGGKNPSDTVTLKEENEDDIYDLPVCAIGGQPEQDEGDDLHEERDPVSAPTDKDLTPPKSETVNDKDSQGATETTFEFPDAKSRAPPPLETEKSEGVFSTNSKFDPAQNSLALYSTQGLRIRRVDFNRIQPWRKSGSTLH